MVHQKDVELLGVKRIIKRLIQKTIMFFNMWIFSQVLCKKNMVLGVNTFWNKGAYINAKGGLIIGSNTLIGPYVLIHTANHDFNDFSKFNLGPVKIGSNCWIGGHVIILPNLVIGDNCIIGAGSVVTKNIPSNCLAVGNPARVIKKV